ncbi:hypothetical protein C1646_742159 [Rhizophagus diaphanus]|nr:hypothetical protein C1646_742159 [Rhizophagus diaphanus] [Rhizophagus sp. MUCL 43196]
MKCSLRCIQESYRKFTKKKRTRSKIVLDRIVIEKDSIKQLISDDNIIEQELIAHYKNFAEKKLNTEEGLQERWLQQYAPKHDINEYWAQLLVWSPTQAEKLNVTCRYIFKRKASLPLTIPNSIIHSSMGYGIKDINTIQAQRQLSRIYNQVTAKGLMKDVFDLECKQLQARVLALLYDNMLSIRATGVKINQIQGGSVPLTDIITHKDIFQKGRIPSWFKFIENMIVDKPLVSKKVKNEYQLEYTRIDDHIKEDDIKARHWLSTFNDQMIKIYELKVILVKVKVHDNNEYNTKVDKLAKLGAEKEVLILEDTLLLHNSSIYWRDMPIERNPILMIKGIKDA